MGQRATPTIALAALLALGQYAHAGDADVRPLDLRFETLRPGASLLDVRRDQDPRDESFGYSAVNDPLSGETSAGVYHPISERLTSLLEATQTQGMGLTSEWSMLGQIGASFGGGWGLNAALRHSELGLQQVPLGHSAYAPAGSADLGMVSVERWWNSYRGSYTYYAGRTDTGNSASGHRFQVHYFYGDRNSVGLSYTLGPSLGLGASANADEGDLRNVGITGEHWFTRRWAFNYNALVEDFGDGELKPELRLGLRLRF
jgi:hypothetical protein